uniref:RING-type E3 ubiquitin transferase n=1 Tax=Ciona savignyi TaxID=51511 RepID=H2Y6J6_CIOSA
SSFVDFQHVAYLTTSVVHLFVDIEFTDDPHQFEQKFNYRRPLYPILRFLWDEEQGRGKQAIREKALEALQNIEATKPPLLLSFINLFLNDSIFLIDEAIDHMRQIKVQEQERDEGEWEQLAPQEKNEKEMNLQQLVSIARFHNIMSNETVEALSYMS